MTDDGCRPYQPTHHVWQISFRDFPMRVGTKMKRTMYLRTGRTKESDVFVGVADTPELAAEIMKAVNIYYGHEEG